MHPVYRGVSQCRSTKEATPAYSMRRQGRDSRCWSSRAAGLIPRSHPSTASCPFNPLKTYANDFRCIAADLRNANGGQSTGPLEIDRPWDAYSQDQLGLMDHLGIEKFGVIGFCIGGPMIHNLLRLAPDRIVAAALMQPQRVQAGDAGPLLPEQYHRLGAAPLREALGCDHGNGPRLPGEYVYQPRRLCFHRHPRFRAQLANADPDRAPRTCQPTPTRWPWRWPTSRRTRRSPSIRGRTRRNTSTRL